MAESCGEGTGGTGLPVIGEQDVIPLSHLLANVAACRRCKMEIYADDDEAQLCTRCRGGNRLWPTG